MNGFGKVKTELCPQKVLRKVSSKTAESWRLGGREAGMPKARTKETGDRLKA